MYCQNLLELALIARRARPHLRGPRDEVLRALRADRLGDQRQGPVGRAGRLLLRRPARRRHARSRCGRARSSACCRSPRSPRSGPQTMARLPDFMTRAGVVHDQPPRRSRAWFSTWSRPSTPAGGCCRSSTSSGCGGSSRRCSTRSEFLSDHGLRALSRCHATSPLHVDVDGVTADARLRAGRVDERAVRRQLQLARAGLVPDQLPARRGARASTTATSAIRFRVRVPDRKRQRDEPRARSPTSSPAADRDLPAGARTDRARCSAATACSRQDPAWNELIPFHEYFHGDTGAGLGASHQTGWTGLVADLIIRQGRG